MRAGIGLGLAALLAGSPAARAETVDLALVLVDDVSLSINDDEYALQKQGYDSAFHDPRVLAAIRGGPSGQIAVAYVEFAGAAQVQTVLGWTIVKDEASAEAFAAAMRGAARTYRGHTAIGAGIDEGMRVLGVLPAQAERKVIDVCGDGTANAGRPVTDARDDALRQGVIINGLALANESATPWLQAHTHPPGGLGHYYRENVTGGEGSFVLEIHSYESFAEAITRKLVEEIASVPVRPPQHG